MNEVSSLERTVSLSGAVLLGLGSILGTGVFVSLAIAAGNGGSLALWAVVIAGLVAAANGLSSAQLAATFPVSGGTYEYAHRTVNQYAGFVAGWMFLCAKSASAATAALGIASYALRFTSVENDFARTAVAAGVSLAMTALVAGGMRRSEQVNRVIVGFTLLSLLVLIAASVPSVARENFGSGTGSLPSLFESAALVFVAFTGYGRVATLGEEVRDPRSTIPKAIIATLVVTIILYVAVMGAGIGVLGAEAFGGLTEDGDAPLAALADVVGGEGLAALLAVGALTAMLGVLLNLVLGLSRVALAMGRRSDLPAGLGVIGKGSSPRAAAWAVGAGITLLTLSGDVRTTWSFSAVTVLIYYALTNLAALRLHAAQRLYPRWIAVAGLAGCLGLAVFIDARIWIAALALTVGGLVVRAISRRHGTRERT